MRTISIVRSWSVFKHIADRSTHAKVNITNNVRSDVCINTPRMSPKDSWHINNGINKYCVMYEQNSCKKYRFFK